MKYPVKSIDHLIDFDALARALDALQYQLKEAIWLIKNSGLGEEWYHKNLKNQHVDVCRNVLSQVKGMWPEMDIDFNSRDVQKIRKNFRKAIKFARAKSKEHPFQGDEVTIQFGFECLAQINATTQKVLKIYSPIQDENEKGFYFLELPKIFEGVAYPHFRLLGGNRILIRDLECRNRIPGIEFEKIVGTTATGCVVSEQKRRSTLSYGSSGELTQRWASQYGYALIPTQIGFDVLAAIPQTGRVFIISDVKQGSFCVDEEKNLKIFDLLMRKLSVNDVIREPALVPYLKQLEKGMKEKYPDFKLHSCYEKALKMLQRFPRPDEFQKKSVKAVKSLGEK